MARAAQGKACTADDSVMSGGLVYPPTLMLDTLLFTFNYTCRRSSSNGAGSSNGSDSFCAPQIEAWFNDSSPTAQQNCSDCYLGTLQTELNSFFGYDAELADEFSSLTQSCGASGYPTTSPAPYLLPARTTNATTTSDSQTTATASCNDQYTVRDGDDCHSISIAHNVSTSALLVRNQLPAHCVAFAPPGTRLCLPPPCAIYTVAENDTCYGIVDAHSHAFTVTQLVAWNPNINRACTNMDQLASEQICVGPPGGTSGFQTTASGVNPTEATSIAPVSISRRFCTASLSQVNMKD